MKNGPSWALACRFCESGFSGARRERTLIFVFRSRVLVVIIIIIIVIIIILAPREKTENSQAGEGPCVQFMYKIPRAIVRGGSTRQYMN